MKKLLMALPILFALSCGNTEEKTGDATVKTDEHAGHNHAADENAVISIKTHDPVCKMVRDEKWAIESVYEGETVKFCSPVCKEKFDKDPSSFVAK